MILTPASSAMYALTPNGLDVEVRPHHRPRRPAAEPDRELVDARGPAHAGNSGSSRSQSKSLSFARVLLRLSGRARSRAGDARSRRRGSSSGPRGRLRCSAPAMRPALRGDASRSSCSRAAWPRLRFSVVAEGDEDLLPARDLVWDARLRADREDGRLRLRRDGAALRARLGVDERPGRRVDLVVAEDERRATAGDEVELLVRRPARSAPRRRARRPARPCTRSCRRR